VAQAAIAVATAATLGVLAALQIIPTSARAVIPLGSMIISGAMNTTSLVMSRLRDDLTSNRREIETRLSLAQTSRQASRPWLRSGLRSGMLPSVDLTKVVGLVALPGAMTGMILAGASPLAAVRLHLVVMYMLLGGTAFAAPRGRPPDGRLALHRFPPAHQVTPARPLTGTGGTLPATLGDLRLSPLGMASVF
jgi:putative ABC transport system permease protein